MSKFSAYSKISGPKQSLILARLSGGPLAQTGVMQGMSGSPVYIDGKLVGAVAMAFPFAKDPIAGIRPIEDMLRAARSAGATRPIRAARLSRARYRDLTRALSGPRGRHGRRCAHDRHRHAGFLRRLQPRHPRALRAAIARARPGTPPGRDRRRPRSSTRMGNPADLKPGSMISVQLMTGDLSVGADGTVTYIDGNADLRLRPSLPGSSARPRCRSRAPKCITLLPNAQHARSRSRRAKEWMGTIYQDRNTAVAGELGQRAGDGAGLHRRVRAGRKPSKTTRCRWWTTALLSPLLLQMAVFSAIDATERTVGASSFRVTRRDRISERARARCKLDNMFAADNGSAMQASLSAAIPLAYVLQSGVRRAQAEEGRPRDRVLRREEAAARSTACRPSRREVRPGEKIQLHVLLHRRERRGDHPQRRIRGAHRRRRRARSISPWPTRNTTNITEFRQILTANPRKSAAQLLSTVNNLHPNTKAYVRVWRADPAYPTGRRGLPGSARLGRPDPGGLANEPGRHHADPQFQNRRNGDRRRRHGDLRRPRPIQVEVKE